MNKDGGDKAINSVSWRKICEARDAVTRCQTAELEASETHKATKAATRAAQDAMNELIDELREPSLFNKGDE